jgi:hypothetical protein
VAERDFPRRVFIEDLRRDGMFLRVTWHPEHSAFVLSHWQQDVCVAATRVAVEDVAPVVALLTNGLADALVSTRQMPPAPPTRRPNSRQRLLQKMSLVWARRARRRRGADIIEFPERVALTWRDDKSKAR